MNDLPPLQSRFSGRHWKRAVLLAAALTLQACSPADQQQTTADVATEAGVLLESTASVPEIEPQGPAAAEPAPLLPVYWLGKDNGLLYREFLPAEATGDPIAAAIWAMTSQDALDGDYYSPWQSASSVNTSISPDNVITVDISSDAFRAGVAADVAQRAVQQLVYTATAAAANSGLIAGGSPSSVRLLVDGKAGYEAFGHIGLGSVLQRDVSFVAPVWIINPQDGSVRTDQTVIMQGSTTSTGSNLQWRVRRMTSDSMPAEDVVTGSVPVEAAAGAAGLYEFSVALEPGTYLVEVYDPALGEVSEDAGSDDKILTIR